MLGDDKSRHSSEIRLMGPVDAATARPAESFPLDDQTARRVLTIDAGLDDPAGDWTFVIGEMVGDNADSQVRIGGPWEFSFSMP
jgi:hypothetical protein